MNWPVALTLVVLPSLVCAQSLPCELVDGDRLCVDVDGTRNVLRVVGPADGLAELQRLQEAGEAVAVEGVVRAPGELTLEGISRVSLRPIGGRIPSTSRAPVPAAAAVDPRTLPSEAQLRALAPGGRASLLTGLATTARETPSDRDRAVTAMQAVLEATDPGQLRATLESAARARALGFVVESVGLNALIAIGAARAVNVNDVLAESDTVRTRGLTSREAERVDANFRGALNWRNVRFHFTQGAPLLTASAMVVGTTVFVDPTQYALAPGTTRPADFEDETYQQVLLGHELAHILSFERFGWAIGIDSFISQVTGILETGSRGGGYTYSVEPILQGTLKTVFALPEEPRAMFLQDTLEARRRLRAGATTVSIYEPTGHRQVEIGRFLTAAEPYLDELLTPPAVRYDDALAQRIRADPAEALHALGGEVWRRVEEQPLLGAALLAGAIALSGIRPEGGDLRRGPGSDVLRQLGIPVGARLSVFDALERELAWIEAELEYAAGFRDPAVRVGGGVNAEDGRLELGATVGLNGALRRVDGRVVVTRDDGTLTASVDHTRDWFGDTTLASLRVASPEGALSAALRSERDLLGRQVEGSVTLEAGGFSVGAARANGYREEWTRLWGSGPVAPSTTLRIDGELGADTIGSIRLSTAPDPNTALELGAAFGQRGGESFGEFRLNLLVRF